MLVCTFTCVPVHSFYIWGPGTQGWGLRQDGPAHIWREGQVQKSCSSCAQGLTFDMEFLCFFRGILKRLCWVLEASGASEERKVRIWTKGTQKRKLSILTHFFLRPDSREGFFASFDLCFLQEFIFKLLQKWVIKFYHLLVTLVTKDFIIPVKVTYLIDYIIILSGKWKIVNIRRITINKDNQMENSWGLPTNQAQV